MKIAIKRQGGFTLVEIAIVLVIIGLLLGGVLKGQELIDNSRAKRMVSDFNGITAAYYSYRDRYNALPGDDGPAATIQARGGNWAAMGSGDDDNVLEVTLAQTFTGAGENDEFFRHLRAAGYISGNIADTGVDALPTNPFGGLIGITTATSHGTLTGVKVCMGNIPGKIAAGLDNQLDDGNGQTGTLRGNVGATNTIPTAAVGTVAYLEDDTYTVCRQL